MTQQKFWLGTALVGLMIGISSPSGAQQYFTRFQPSDKPPVEVDMGFLDAKPAAPLHKTRVADSEYIRSSDVSSPSAAEIAAEPAPLKPAAEPATTAKKKTAKKSSKKKSKTIAVTDEPTPGTVAHAAAPAGPIISQPPVMETAAPAPAQRDIGALGPIISNSPDAPARPASVRENLMAAPVVDHHPMSAPPPEAAPAAAPALEADSDLLRGAAPVHPAPKQHAAAPTPRYEAPVAHRETPEVTEDRPLASPLPDIKVVHEADNPEVDEPLPVPQPPVHHEPRDEPLKLPKAAKIGTTTAPLLMPRADLGEHMTPPPPVTEPAAAPGLAATPEPAITQPLAGPADIPPTEDVTSSIMPTVPSIADLTLGFSGNSSDLTSETQKKLDAVIRQMKELTDGRLQVRGFATGEDGSTSSARRIALSRALSVRSYLMDKGIKPTRVDVRAMGTDTERSPLDRVDLLFVR